MLLRDPFIGLRIVMDEVVFDYSKAVIYGVVKEVKVHLAGALYILVWMSLLSDIEMLCEAARGAYCRILCSN